MDFYTLGQHKISYYRSSFPFFSSFLRKYSPQGRPNAPYTSTTQ